MKICIDSNTISYLFQAIDNYCPENDNETDLRKERMAMIRIRYYVGGRLTILPSVRYEINKITDVDKWLKHVAIEDWLDKRVFNLNELQVVERKLYFLKYHNQELDCRILAEAESLKMNILLSHDNNFKARLNERTDKVTIISPSDYLCSLNISHGTEPKLRPLDRSNPLFRKTWWRI